MQLTLAAHSPFSLRSVIYSHGWIRLAPFREDEAQAGFVYAARLDSGTVADLRIGETVDGVVVSCDSLLDECEQAEVARKVACMLALDQDFAEFYVQTGQEPKLADVEGEAKGRLLRSATVFEDVVKTILTTNTAWSGTIRMVGALVDLFGSPVDADSGRRAFPSPQQLASTDEATLRGEAKLGYRAPYILELARSVAAGDLDLEMLRSAVLPTAELRKHLLAIKGVGSYAAASLLMLLGHYDFVPVDSWAYTVVSHEWYGGKAIGKAEVEAAFEQWGKWKGLAYWFWDWSYTDSG